MQVLIIDAGTTSVRATLFNEVAKPLHSHQIEFKQYFPEPGWVEHDPDEIWRNVVTCCQEVLAVTATAASEVSGIGITNQRETTVVWDTSTGQSLGRAIVWQDRRTANLCETLKNQQLEPLIQAKTGLLLDPYFSAAKIVWLLNHFDANSKARRGELLFGTIDCYLLWRLTGGKSHATDITNASRTMLFNINEACWDDELLDLFKIPRNMLPEVKENCAHFGESDQNLFGASIPIVAMIGDQQAATIGEGCIDSNDAKCTYGTGGFLMVNTGPKLQPVSCLINTIAYSINGTIIYGIEGSIFAVGAIIKWLRDQLGLIQSAEETETLAKELPDNGGVYMVPAFTGLGAPYWDPKARGAIYGLTRDTSPAHFARSALEAIAYQTKDLLDTLENLCHLKKLKVDGGVTANRWLMQFVADILQIPIEVSANKEATSLGTAYLALLAVGAIKRFDIIKTLAERKEIFEPKMSIQDVARLHAGWLNSLKRTQTSYIVTS